MALNFPSSPSDGQIFQSGNLIYKYNNDNGVWEKVVRLNAANASVSFVIEGEGSVISMGTKGTIEIPNGLTIERWSLLADQVGSANVDLWSRDYSTTPPTQANSVTGNVGMTISSANANQSTEISNWRMKKINAGNVITYNVQSCSVITKLTVSLQGQGG